MMESIRLIEKPTAGEECSGSPVMRLCDSCGVAHFDKVPAACDNCNAESFTAYVEGDTYVAVAREMMRLAVEESNLADLLRVVGDAHDEKELTKSNRVSGVMWTRVVEVLSRIKQSGTDCDK